MSVLTIADSFDIGVSDLTSSVSWYIEKLGLQKIAGTGYAEGCVALGFSTKDHRRIVLGPRYGSTDATTAMLYTSNPQKARELLSSRGVPVGEIQQDRQGTHILKCRIWRATSLRCLESLSLLITLPWAVVVTGSLTFLRSWSKDREAPRNVQEWSAAIYADPVMMFVGALTLTAGVVLAIVAVHMAAN